MARFSQDELRAGLAKLVEVAKLISENRRKRRQRDDENEDGDNANGKIRATEDFRKMGVKELREQTILRGISTTGLKKELLKRLCNCNDAEKKASNLNNDENNLLQEGEESKKEKLIIVKKKRTAVLDQWIPDDIKATYHVLQDEDDIYDATLNQTNVEDNTNKFFIIQLLESDGGGRYMLYYRSGRVGSKGRQKLNGPDRSKHPAMEEFKSKFYVKTGIEWCDRQYFDAHYPKKYTWLEMDYNKTDQQSAIFSKVEIQNWRETKLEARVAKFIALICNISKISMTNQQTLEIGYNAPNLPLGKLSKSTILKGYDVLKRIADVIGQKDRKMLEQLSGEFFTVIPHALGYRKMSQLVIDTPQKLKAKLKMVEALGEIEVTTKLLEDDIWVQDPLYSRYKRLHCELTPVDIDSQEFAMIQKYMRNGQVETHSGYVLQILFKYLGYQEWVKLNVFRKTGNRMLLWHGSPLTNWTEILSQGLRNLGAGVFFADMFSKSAPYCHASYRKTNGVLLLCEVALGDMAVNCIGFNLPAGKLSRKLVGNIAPDFSQSQLLDDGVIVPLGSPKVPPVPMVWLILLLNELTNFYLV